MDEAIVKVSRAKLADQPGGKTLENLPKGSRVVVRGGPPAWVEVESQGTIGVISRRSLEFVATPPIAARGASRAAFAATPAAPPVVPPKANAADIKIAGKAVLGPGGLRFGTLFKLGLFNNGETSLGRFFAQDPGAFPGLSPSVTRVMQAVSVNEGKIEAINTWDNAILSCSVYQWTTAEDAGKGELPYALAFLKADAPATFKTFFGDEGLDVQVATGAFTGFFLLNGKLLDNNAKKAPLRTHIWAYRFWRAAHDTQVRRAYVKAAISRIDRFHPVKIAALGNRPMSDYISTEVGVAQILDQHVNRPGHVPKTLVTAIQAFIAAGGASNPANWRDKDERDVLKIYIRERAKTSMTDTDKRAERIQDCVTAGTLSDKRGSFVR